MTAHSNPTRAFRASPVATLTIGVGLLVAVLLGACADDSASRADIEAENLEVVSEFIEEFKNQANHDIVFDLFAEDFVHHLGDPNLPAGRDGMVALGQGVHGAFPDVQVTVEDLIASDDMVIERTTARGTHQGPFQNVPATGNSVMWTETHIYRLDGGVVVEYWPQVDILAILLQIGAVPPPGQ